MSKRFKTVSFITVLFVYVNAPAADNRPFRGQFDGYQLVRITVDDEADVQTLKRLDRTSREFQVWTDRVGMGGVDVRVSPKQKQVLDASGLRYTVEVEDWQRHLDRVFKGAGDLDFFDSYRTHEEHVAFVHDLAETYPDLAETVSIGRSVEGRFMWAIRITGPGTDKPGLMYHGAQHGNEVMGAAVVAYMAEHLLTNYDTDPEVRALVDNVEWYLLTVMNPDGYSDNDRYNANNADLNRNWGGPGANPNPFSQPETAAMRDFFLAHPNVRAHLDFHTFGRMILWPWGHTPDPCVDDPTFRMIGDDMAALIFQSRGTDYDRRGPIYTTIYPVNGDSVGYTYGELGVWGIGFELGYSHSMPTSEIIPTCQEMAPAMMYLAEFISDCNRNTILDSEEIIAGTVEDCNANTVPDECESFLDFDGDGLLDPCDPDLDADGVPNTSDVCDYTPIGTPVDEDGRPLSDVNGNCDTDLGDFIRVGYCLDLSGPGTPTTSSFCTTYFDYDDNGVIDLTDVGGFMRAFTGEPPAVR